VITFIRATKVYLHRFTVAGDLGPPRHESRRYYRLPFCYNAALLLRALFGAAERRAGPVMSLLQQPIQRASIRGLDGGHSLDREPPEGQVMRLDAPGSSFQSAATACSPGGGDVGGDARYGWKNSERQGRRRRDESGDRTNCIRPLAPSARPDHCKVQYSVRDARRRAETEQPLLLARHIQQPLCSRISRPPQTHRPKPSSALDLTALFRDIGHSAGQFSAHRQKPATWGSGELDPKVPPAADGRTLR
jgi:hypothetical protein